MDASPETIMATAMPSPEKIVAAVASVAATAMLLRTVIKELVPQQVRTYLSSGLNSLHSRVSSELTLLIPETEAFAPNQLYHSSITYLATRIPPSTRRLRVSKQEEQKSIAVSIEKDEAILDSFQGIYFRWRLIIDENSALDHRRGGHGHRHAPVPTEIRSLELSFHKKHKTAAIESYLPHIIERAKAIKEEDKSLRLYMNDGDWSPAAFHHPATFDTLAMEAEVKRAVMEDLTRFVARKDYYKRIGKAWKRGYLLYGPPGTGKSSLIAAMANFLRFDIYDLDLTEVSYNSELRRLLVGTANRSILVVEDIDCSVDLQKRDPDGEPEVKNSASSSETEPKVTLSGLLNFVDGLWSTCGEERIIVFTTNYIEKLDPALLRPGRMDMHIHMGYCGITAFRILASNYHGIGDHHLFGEIEGLLGEVEVTPAEVAEELIRSDDVETALQGLIGFLREKRKDKGGECIPSLQEGSES